MSQAKGDRFMRELQPWIETLFPRAQKRGKGLPGPDWTDTGDFSFEAKNQDRMRLGEWMNQTLGNALELGHRWPVLIHKRRRYNTSRAYVTMTVEDWFTMVAGFLDVELPPELQRPKDD